MKFGVGTFFSVIGFASAASPLATLAHPAFEVLAKFQEAHRELQTSSLAGLLTGILDQIETLDTAVVEQCLNSLDDGLYDEIVGIVENDHCVELVNGGLDSSYTLGDASGGESLPAALMHLPDSLLTILNTGVIAGITSPSDDQMNAVCSSLADDLLANCISSFPLMKVIAAYYSHPDECLPLRELIDSVVEPTFEVGEDGSLGLSENYFPIHTELGSVGYQDVQLYKDPVLQIAQVSNTEDAIQFIGNAGLMFFMRCGGDVELPPNMFDWMSPPSDIEGKCIIEDKFPDLEYGDTDCDGSESTDSSEYEYEPEYELPDCEIDLLGPDLLAATGASAIGGVFTDPRVVDPALTVSCRGAQGMIEHVSTLLPALGATVSVDGLLDCSANVVEAFESISSLLTDVVTENNWFLAQSAIPSIADLEFNEIAPAFAALNTHLTDFGVVTVSDLCPEMCGVPCEEEVEDSVSDGDPSEEDDAGNSPGDEGEPQEEEDDGSVENIVEVPAEHNTTSCDGKDFIGVEFLEAAGASAIGGVFTDPRVVDPALTVSCSGAQGMIEHISTLLPALGATVSVDGLLDCSANAVEAFESISSLLTDVVTENNWFMAQSAIPSIADLEFNEIAPAFAAFNTHLTDSGLVTISDLCPEMCEVENPCGSNSQEDEGGAAAGEDDDDADSRVEAEDQEEDAPDSDVVDAAVSAFAAKTSAAAAVLLAVSVIVGNV